MAGGAPDYYKAILLYGIYEGEVVPLACDKQGRLILISEPVSPFDKAGTVLLRDDFGDGLVHVHTATAGTGATVALESTEAAKGGYSCKLTGGSDGAQTASVLWFFYPSQLNKIGFQFAVRTEPFAERFRAQLYARNGVSAYTAQVRYNTLAIAWQLYDPDAADWVNIIESYLPAEAAHEFITFKLVIDIEAETFHAFKTSNQTVDISAYSLQKAADTTYEQARALLEVKAVGGGTGYILIDDIVITQDES